MAVLEPSEYTVGDVARLWPPNRQTKWLNVTAPNGQRFKIETRNGRVELWLAQPGTWSYQWGVDDVRQVEVKPPEPAEEMGPVLPKRWVS